MGETYAIYIELAFYTTKKYDIAEKDSGENNPVAQLSGQLYLLLEYQPAYNHSNHTSTPILDSVMNENQWHSVQHSNYKLDKHRFMQQLHTLVSDL